MDFLQDLRRDKTNLGTWGWLPRGGVVAEASELKKVDYRDLTTLGKAQEKEKVGRKCERQRSLCTSEMAPRWEGPGC